MMPHSLTGRLQDPRTVRQTLHRGPCQEERGRERGEVWRLRGGRGDTLTWTRNSLLNGQVLVLVLVLQFLFNVRSFGQVYP